ARGATLTLEGQVLPFVPLAELLSRKRRAGPAPTMWTVVVVQARGAQAAIGVNRLNGVRTVVLRPLPPLSGSNPLFAGATLDGEGNPELVLDPPALVTALRAGSASAPEPEVVP